MSQEELDSLTSEIPEHAREGLQLAPSGLLDDFPNSYQPIGGAVAMYLASFKGGNREDAAAMSGFVLSSMPLHYREYLKRQHQEPSLAAWIDRNAQDHAQLVAEVDGLIDNLNASRPVLEKMAAGTATEEEVLPLKALIEAVHRKASGRADFVLDGDVR